MITADLAELTTDDVPRFYTLKDAAARLNLKPWQLRRMARRGELQLYFVGNKRIRVILSETVEAIRRFSGQSPDEAGCR